MIEPILEAKKALLGIAVALLVVQNSFRNLAYRGIYWIAFSKGMLIFA